MSTYGSIFDDTSETKKDTTYSTRLSPIGSETELLESEKIIFEDQHASLAGFQSPSALLCLSQRRLVITIWFFVACVFIFLIARVVIVHLERPTLVEE